MQDYNLSALQYVCILWEVNANGKSVNMKSALQISYMK